MRLNRRTIDQIDSPIGAAYALVDDHDQHRRLLDLAQAAPQYPPAPAVREHVARVVADDHGGDYVELSGLPQLRSAIAEDLRRGYGGRVDTDQVLVTAGCNQAFCLTASTLAGPGDEIIMPLPYYFNHDMWLRMQGIRPVYLEPGPDLTPSPEAAERLINPRTRAIVLVTPGNPSGVTVPPDRIAAMYLVAERHGIALVLDETYRSFRGTDEPAHRLFDEADWTRTVISLHSFSKDLALPGYRVGAVVGGADLLREVMKVLDCVAICAPRVGQEAAWAGLTTAAAWRRERAADMAARCERFAAAMAAEPGGFELVSCGGFFGWVRHPFVDRRTEDVVRDLAVEQRVLVIPGTAFLPDDRRMLRMSFGNIDTTDLPDLTDRLVAAGTAGR